MLCLFVNKCQLKKLHVDKEIYKEARLIWKKRKGTYEENLKEDT